MFIQKFFNFGAAYKYRTMKKQKNVSITVGEILLVQVC